MTPKALQPTSVDDGGQASAQGRRPEARRFQFDQEQVARYLAAGNVRGARVHCALYGQDFHEIAGILEDALTKQAGAESAADDGVLA